jgi:hypothetical protein
MGVKAQRMPSGNSIPEPTAGGAGFGTPAVIGGRYAAPSFQRAQGCDEIVPQEAITSPGSISLRRVVANTTGFPLTPPPDAYNISVYTRHFSSREPGVPVGLSDPETSRSTSGASSDSSLPQRVGKPRMLCTLQGKPCDQPHFRAHPGEACLSSPSDYRGDSTRLTCAFILCRNGHCH